MTNQDFPYEVLEEFGRGGCSVIYKVKRKDDRDKKQYVLKTMTLGDDDQQNHQRFYMEYEFLRAYPHSNLIEVREYFNDWHGRPGYVMEWIEGATWQNYWRDRKVLEAIPTFLLLFKQLCDGLDFIHKHQIIHRDLKPQNILVSKEDVVKIIDFGIMKVADLTMYTHRNTFMGSAYYVAPEGVADEPVNHTADIFSLGVILYDLFTGMKPFQGHTLGETIYQRLVKKPQNPSHIAEVPIELDAILLKMLERDPRHRQQSCQEVFRELEGVFRKFQPEPMVQTSTEVDILTKEPLLHTHFIQACQAFIKEKNILVLVGDEGSGKTTIVENLCDRLFRDSMTKVDCRSHSTELEFMEAILRNVSFSNARMQKLAGWREILGNALPGLHWAAPARNDDTLNIGTIVSAFIKVLGAVNEDMVIVLEDLQHAEPALLNFAAKLGQFASGRFNPHMNLIVTIREPLPVLASLGAPIRVVFPDVLGLNDFLAGQFGGCQIPLDLTHSLVEISGENIGEFVRMVKHLKSSDQLYVEDSKLHLAEDDFTLNTLPAMDARSLTNVPPPLMDFSIDELAMLEWIALCPEGVSLNILKAVTQIDIGSLGTTLEKAAGKGLLESQSTVTDGFRWKDEVVQNHLLQALTHEEKTHRYLTLATTIEAESKLFLAQSPPLWLILCRVYQQAEDDDRASDFGFRYARYCFQNANYEPIRTYLTQFIPLPKFHENLEFWCLLALAYHTVDINQALYYGRKALAIEENTQSLALMSILEYHGQNEAEARELVNKLMQTRGFANLENHYITLLMPILIALGEDAQPLMNILETKLAGRTDLNATNTLILARVMLLQNTPQKLISAIRDLDQEMLPQTYRKLNLWAGNSYQELFEYEKALASLRCMDHAGMSDPRWFRDLLFLYMNFNRVSEVKKLISNFRQVAAQNANLQKVAPVFDLITELLVNDPKIYDFKHVIDSLILAGVEKSAWLTLIINCVNSRLLKRDFLNKAMTQLMLAAVPWARHQIPRLRIMSEVKSGRQINLTQLLQDAIDLANKHGLVTERLRLYNLKNELKQFGHTVARLEFYFEPGFLDRQPVFQFTKLGPR